MASASFYEHNVNKIIPAQVLHVRVCVCIRVLPSLALNCLLTDQVCYKCQLQQTYHKCFVESPTTCND